MPTITATAEPRTSEILDRVKAVFASKGFDGASMQDLARAAGMSAGNFYRYFPSKSAIIEAMIERELDEVGREFTRILESPRPLDGLRELVRYRVETLGQCDGLMWAEIEATAARRPEIAVHMSRIGAEITRNLVAVFARIAEIPEAEAEQRFSAHARLIVMMVQGLSMTSCGLGFDVHRTPDRDLAALVVTVIERILTEIAVQPDPFPIIASKE